MSCSRFLFVELNACLFFSSLFAQMGLDSELKQVIDGMVADAIVPCPDGIDVIFDDALTALHPLKHSKKTVICGSTMELYELFMTKPRLQWKSCTDLKDVFLVFDTGNPVIKLAEQDDRTDAKRAAPYSDAHAIYKHQLCTVRQSDTNPDDFIITDGPLPIHIGRLLSSRRLRHELYASFVELACAGETIPAGCALFIHWSVDPQLSPICITTVNGKQCIRLATEYHTTWIESDHAISWLMTKHYELKKFKNAMVLTGDGDLLLTLMFCVFKMMASCNPAKAAPVCITRNPTADAKMAVAALNENPNTAPTIMQETGNVYRFNRGHPQSPIKPVYYYINAMVAILYNSKRSVEMMMLLAHLCGNDYVSKDTITYRIGPENLAKGFDRFVRNGLDGKTSPSRDGPSLLKTLQDDAAFLKLVRTIVIDAESSYANVKNVPPIENIRAPRQRIANGIAAWTLCCSTPHPCDPVHMDSDAMFLHERIWERHARLVPAVTAPPKPINHSASARIPIEELDGPYRQGPMDSSLLADADDL